MTIMARYSMARSTPKVSGTIWRKANANSTPPRPASIEDTRKEDPLKRVTCTPITDAATSPSRTACIARPARLDRRLR
jgi:hypothetical protein